MMLTLTGVGAVVQDFNNLRWVEYVVVSTFIPRKVLARSCGVC